MLTLFYHGAIVPKARPQVTRNGTYMPRKYREWKSKAIASFAKQCPHSPKVSGVTIEIILRGKHNRRGDADNTAGAILDALKQADIIQDDNLKHVPAIACWLEYSKNDPIAEIKIGLAPDE